jgi:hypothetical protein
MMCGAVTQVPDDLTSGPAAGQGRSVVQLISMVQLIS